MSVLPPSYTELARACMNCRHATKHSKRMSYVCLKIKNDNATEDDRVISAYYGHCAEFAWCDEAVAQFKADRSSP